MRSAWLLGCQELCSALDSGRSIGRLSYLLLVNDGRLHRDWKDFTTDC